jgi:C-terminal processing protease CtpA/Prc
MKSERASKLVALERLRKTSRLIVDVRLNGGGSETIARAVAGRFVEKEFTYGYNQIRSGPNHTNLTSRFERRVKPEGPWRYEGVVTLLIGQKCMSSSESFVAMMSGAPRVAIMGDRTCGSSGNPKTIGLPLEMTVSVPRWIDYLPDGTAIDEKGFQPAEKFEATAGAFEDRRDALLAAALGRLRKD